MTAIDPTLLDKLAELAVKRGVNLQPGQDLLITAPVEALPLVRKIAEHAYRAGGGLVTPILSDEEITLARFQHGQGDVFDRAPGWLFEAQAAAYGQGVAPMAVLAENPMMLAEQDPAKVARANKARSVARRPAMEKVTNFEVNWNIVPYPGAAWARAMFPDLPEDEAVAKLAAAIFAATRADQPDPVAAWAAHADALRARVDWMNDQRFDALHFRAPGTDLTVGLARDHAWSGGASVSKTGVLCSPNMPTEEVFTTPDAARVSGTARASKPLVHQGTLIENIEVRFEGGRIVEAKASRGEAVLLNLLDTDEGARRLGEVALVPHGSPISQSGLLFLNTLFDENAASHIALGQCYAKCFTDPGMSREEIAARGGNESLIHVDWMIGSGEMDVDGIKDGRAEPVMRAGEWASDL